MQRATEVPRAQTSAHGTLAWLAAGSAVRKMPNPTAAASASEHEGEQQPDQLRPGQHDDHALAARQASCREVAGAPGRRRQQRE
jgi:hypothetical protein